MNAPAAPARILGGLVAIVIAVRLAWEATPPADGRTLAALLLVAIAAALVLPLLRRGGAR